MKNNTRKPLVVSREAVEAYEKKTGFHGIGQIMVEDGHWKIVSGKGSACGKI